MKNGNKILSIILPSILLIGAIIISLKKLDNTQKETSLMRLNNFPTVTLTRQKNDRLIGRLEESLRRDGETPKLLVTLGNAYLQHVRETGEYGFYRKAEKAFQKVLDNPETAYAEAMAGMAEICLGRHQFDKAYLWAQKAQQRLPDRAIIYGLMSDAEIELGRYEQAVQTIQKMVDLRPDLSSYSRVAYARELHGDTDGAIEAMLQAVKAGLPGVASTEWCRVQLATLYFNKGDLERTEAGYQQALYYVPGYPYGLAGMAKVRTVQKHYAEAIDFYQSAIAAAKIPEFWAGLGQVYSLMGDTGKANEHFELAWKFLESERDNGIDPDLELAMLGLKIGRIPAEILALAQRAYASRPTILAADVLAWTHYQNSDFETAHKVMQQALRLGTNDASLHYHAGMISYRLGQLQDAKNHLQKALAINPYFSIQGAEDARQVLQELANTISIP